jgi:hypothetical protein
MLWNQLLDDVTLICFFSKQIICCVYEVKFSLLVLDIVCFF